MSGIGIPLRATGEIMKQTKWLWIVAILVCISTVSVAAFSFKPLRMDFQPAGRGSIKTFRIENDSEKPIAVKITMLTREMDIRGNETNRDASHLFLVYPPQVLLQPGNYQTVRVQWKGPAKIEKELNFRIVAEQLPVKFGEEQGEGGSISIMLRYKGSVYIVPENPEFDIQVMRVEPVTTAEGEKKLEFELFNTGNSHIILQDLKVTVSSTLAGINLSTLELSGTLLQGMNGENILAESKRIFTVNWPDGLEDGTLNAEISFKPVR
jgi:fimbrial chaperone protein